MESPTVSPDIFAALTEEFHEDSNPGHTAVDLAEECYECKRIARVLVSVSPSIPSLDAIEEFVAEHKPNLDETACYMGGCSCSWVDRAKYRDERNHDRHLATGLADFFALSVTR